MTITVEERAQAALAHTSYVASPICDTPVAVAPLDLGETFAGIQVAAGLPARVVRIVSDDLSDEEKGRAHRLFDTAGPVPYTTLTFEQVRA